MQNKINRGDNFFSLFRCVFVSENIFEESLLIVKFFVHYVSEMYICLCEWSCFGHHSTGIMEELGKTLV